MRDDVMRLILDVNIPQIEVAQRPKSSTDCRREINDEANLVWLCPNHHKMLELGLITL
jgi:hypothetical protein